MKLLVEQKEYLEQKIVYLKRQLEKFKDERKLNPIYMRINIPERTEFVLQLKELTDELGYYTQVLSNSSLITTFNNTQIDIGTRFQVKFDNEEEITNFTMADVIIGNKIENENYITKESPLGKILYLEKENASFELEVADGSITAVKIVKILPQKNIEAAEENVQSNRNNCEIKIAKKRKESLNHKNRSEEYRNYIRKLKVYEKVSKVAEKELLHLQKITSSQHLQLQDAYLKMLRNLSDKNNCSYTEGHNLSVMRKNLRREVIEQPNPTMIDLGTKMILEIEVKGKKKVEKLEFVSSYLLEENQENYLSVRTTKGFLLYKGQIGDKFTLKATTTHPKEEFTIAQFGIEPEKLLIPTSSNVSNYKKQERAESSFRQKYQKNNHVIMTQSQKERLEYELDKISPDAQLTPYIKRLYELKKAVETKNMVQTEEMLEKNGEYIGIGSKVEYLLLQEEGYKEKTAEVISCAFTTEENDKYIEEFTPLGKSLIGKRKEESFEVNVDGKIEKGIVLSVTNKIVSNEKIYKK